MQYNKDLGNNSFSDGGKYSLGKTHQGPIYKKKYKHYIENYRLVSILNAFSKIYERYIHNSLIPFADNFLS